ncbi:hypothetical protein FGO68_gene3149 [Halteria grandinella]|uniref:Uncharacterized protein n=1 Tax=Halteria grandinella TaxID=5974 RepID=A0A8J8NF30_HALGN|nr:hypothetical protein FGO68_gene3149 [Halteria grandinella]
MSTPRNILIWFSSEGEDKINKKIRAKNEPSTIQFFLHNPLIINSGMTKTLQRNQPIWTHLMNSIASQCQSSNFGSTLAICTPFCRMAGTPDAYSKTARKDNRIVAFRVTSFGVPSSTRQEVFSYQCFWITLNCSEFICLQTISFILRAEVAMKESPSFQISDITLSYYRKQHNPMILVIIKKQGDDRQNLQIHINLTSVESSRNILKKQWSPVLSVLLRARNPAKQGASTQLGTYSSTDQQVVTITKPQDKPCNPLPMQNTIQFGHIWMTIEIIDASAVYSSTFLLHLLRIKGAIIVVASIPIIGGISRQTMLSYWSPQIAGIKFTNLQLMLIMKSI